MRPKVMPAKTSLQVNTSYIGERIEEKIERIMNNKEPISDGAPLIYTERKDGVQPEYDIRTDRFEVAIDAMDKVAADHRAKREGRLKAVKGGQEEGNKDGDKNKDGGAEPIQGTDNK